MMKAIVLLSICAFLTACVSRGNLHVDRAGESIDIYHNGKDIEQVHTIKPRWEQPGRVASTECQPGQLAYDDFWGINTCPSKYDKHATLGVDVARHSTISYRDLIVPPVINGLFFVAGMGTFAAVFPRTQYTNNNGGVNLRASTVAGEVPGGVPR